MARKKLNDQLTRALTGKVTEPSQKQIETAPFAGLLYDYSSSFDHTDSKKWALEFLEKTNKDLKKKLEKVNSKNFKNLGFVCRIISRGGNIPYTNDEIFSRLEGINQSEQIESVVKPKPRIIEKKNLILYKIDSEMDNIILGKAVPKRFHCDGTKKELTEAVAFVKSQLTDLKENAEYYNKVIAKNLEKFFNSVLETFASAMPKQKVRKARKTKIVDPTSKLTYMKEDVTMAISSIDPKNIVGATLLYLFNIKSKQMIKLVAEEGKTLSVKNSRVINADVELSSKKRISKNIKDMIGTRSMINLSRNFDKIKTNSTRTSFVINDTTLILGAK